MSAKRLMGPAAILGGLLWLAQWWFDGPLGSPTSSIFWVLAIIQVVLLLGVLRGLYTLGRSGRFGKIGLVVASVGAVLMSVAFLLVPLPNAAGWVWFIGVPALTGGWLLFGVANLRSKALARWNGLPLLIAFVPILMSILHDLIGIGWTLPVGGMMLGLGWVLLGYVLWSGSVQRGPEPRSANVSHGTPKGQQDGTVARRANTTANSGKCAKPPLTLRSLHPC